MRCALIYTKRLLPYCTIAANYLPRKPLPQTDSSRTAQDSVIFDLSFRGGLQADMESPCLIAAHNPRAYSFNATVGPHPLGQRLNYLTLWADGNPMPLVSTLNNPTATVVAN